MKNQHIKDIKEVKIGNKLIGYNQPCFIIAEAGVNHNGDMGLARKLVDTAAEAGVDAIKFQIFKAEQVVTEKADMAEYQKENLGTNESQADMLRKLEMNEEQHVEIKKYAESKGLIFLSTSHSGVFGIESLERVGVLGHKIGSGDLNNKPFLEFVAKTKKPMFIGTGMGTMDEVKKAMQWIRDKGNNNFIMLHCTTNYPCPYDEVNMNSMKTMMNEIDCLVGYSDHTMGIEISIMARAMGACVLEDHFTLDRTMEGPDHKASIEPDELKHLVNSIRNLEKAFGSCEKKPHKNEEKMIIGIRKSLVADKDIKKGKIIEESDLIIKRPGTGIQPEDYDQIVGKKAKTDIEKDTLIKYSDLEK